MSRHKPKKTSSLHSTSNGVLVNIEIQLLSRKQIAELWGMELKALDHVWDSLLAQGLKAFKIGREWRVRRVELLRFIENQEP